VRGFCDLLCAPMTGGRHWGCRLTRTTRSLRFRVERGREGGKELRKEIREKHDIRTHRNPPCSLQHKERSQKTAEFLIYSHAQFF